MIRSLWTGASGMQAYQLQVDSIAHNVANVNTPGYRRSQVEFADLLYQETADGRLLLGSGVQILSVSRDLTPAALEATGKPTDLAVAGDGFLMVDGGNFGTLYTRDGSLHVDADGRIVTAGGLALVIEPPPDVTGPVLIPADAVDLAVSEEGILTYKLGGTDQAVVAGHIRLAIPVPSVPGRTVDMLPQGNNLFVPAQDTVMEIRAAADRGTGSIRQGYLERSNVSLVDEFTDLIQAQRAYEFCAKAVETADQMLAVANNIRRG